MSEVASSDIRPNLSVSYQRLSLDDQIVVHYRALELRTLGLAYSQILTRLVCELGARVSKSTLSYWVRGMHEPLGRAYDFKPEPTEELAYLVGVQKGDGSLNVNRETYNYRIRLQSIDPEFVEEFDRCLSRIIDSPRHATWSGAGRKEIHVVGCSFLLHQFLSQPFEKLKPYIEHCSDCVHAFLRGFFDSEDSISKSGSISASNCDKELLEYLQSLLLDYDGIFTTGPSLQSRRGTKMTVRGRAYVRNCDCYVIRMGRRFGRTFLVNIGVTISRKRIRLVKSLSSEKRRV